MKSVFITGATGLLGKMFVKYFLANNYQVIYTSSSEEKIKEFNKEYSDYVDNGVLYGCFVDLMDDDCIKEIRDYLKSNNLRVNYLINNARKLDNVLVSHWQDIDSTKWHDEYHLDVVVPYQLSVELSDLKYELKGIVNIASMYGFLPYNDYLCNGSEAIAINYGICKAALIQLTKELAIRLSNKKIRVNAISYGGVDGRADDAFKRRYADLCPMKDMLNEDDVVGHALYLCSEQSSGMTGQNIVVDGGFSVW